MSQPATQFGRIFPPRTDWLAKAPPEPILDPDLPIIDTHQHLWDLSRFKLPWLKGAPKLDRSFLMDDYRLESLRAFADERSRRRID